MGAVPCRSARGEAAIEERSEERIERMGWLDMPYGKGATVELSTIVLTTCDGLPSIDRAPCRKRPSVVQPHAGPVEFA